MYFLGPLIAFGVVGLLALMLRWVFGSDASYRAARLPLHGPAARFGALPRPDRFEDRPRPDRRSVPADFGLLRAAAVLDTRGAAQATRARLASAGIRATVGIKGGRYQVLVFEAEVERARRLVGGHSAF